LISPGSWAAYAYDARTGKEIWKTHNPAYSPRCVRCSETGSSLSPPAAVRRSCGPCAPTARRCDRHPCCVEVAGRIVPEEPSPLLVDDLLYMAGNDGSATCLDATTGTQVWSERLAATTWHRPSTPTANSSSSACRARRRSSSWAHVRGPGHEQARIRLHASPAVAGKALFLRPRRICTGLRSKWLDERYGKSAARGESVLNPDACTGRSPDDRSRSAKRLSLTVLQRFLS